MTILCLGLKITFPSIFLTYAFYYIHLSIILIEGLIYCWFALFTHWFIDWLIEYCCALFTHWLNNGFYSILFFSILFYSILFYSILLYSILAEGEEEVWLPLPPERRGRQGWPPAIRGRREDAPLYQVVTPPPLKKNPSTDNIDNFGPYLLVEKIQEEWAISSQNSLKYIYLNLPFKYLTIV